MNPPKGWSEVIARGPLTSDEIAVFFARLTIFEGSIDARRTLYKAIELLDKGDKEHGENPPMPWEAPR